MLLFIIIHKVTPSVYIVGTRSMSFPYSMYSVVAIGIILFDAQNGVKIEVFRTFIFCV